MKKIVPALAIREALNADKKKIEKRAIKLKEGKALKENVLSLLEYTTDFARSISTRLFVKILEKDDIFDKNFWIDMPKEEFCNNPKFVAILGNTIDWDWDYERKNGEYPEELDYDEHPQVLETLEAIKRDSRLEYVHMGADQDETNEWLILVTEKY